MIAATSATDTPAWPCPVCTTPVTWPPPAACPTCGAALGGEDARRLAEVDRQLWQLSRERDLLMGRLRSASTPPAAGPPAHRPYGAAAAPAARAPHRLRDASAQTLLAGAGVALLALAAIVFVAVTWEQLSALTRTAVLVAATAAAAAGARILVGRGLRATGEAVAVLAVLLALVDVHGARLLDVAGLRAVDLALYVAITSVVVAAASDLLARWTRTVAPQVCAALLLAAAWVPLASHLTDRFAWDPAGVLAVVLLVGAFALETTRHVHGSAPAGARAILRIAAVLHWLGAVVAAWVSAGGDPAGLWVGVGVAAVAAGGAWLDRAGAWTDALAALAVAVLATVAVATHATGFEPPLAAALVAALAAAALHPVAPARRPALAAGFAPLVFVVWPGLLALAGTVAGAMLAVAEAAWEDVPLAAAGEVALLATLAFTAVAAAGWAGMLGRRPAAVASAVAGMLLTALAATVVAGAPASVRVAAGLAAASAVAVATRSVRLPTGASLVVVAAAGWAIGWSLASSWLTVAALALLAALASTWLVSAPAAHLASFDRRVGFALALAAAVAVPATALGAGGWGADVAGFAAVAAAAAALVAASRMARTAGDLVAAETVLATAAAVGSVLAWDDPRLLATGFAVAGVATAAHGLRPDRRPSLHVATLLLSACAWTLLADADVRTVEAYTALPAALTLLLGGWRVARDEQARSLGSLSAGLVIALVPTAAQVVVEPTDLVRVLLLAGGGAALLLVGTFTRLAAPVVYGAAATGVVVVTQVAVAASHLPRWVTFATLGLLLVIGSATYERQRVRLTSVRARVAALR